MDYLNNDLHRHLDLIQGFADGGKNPADNQRVRAAVYKVLRAHAMLPTSRAKSASKLRTLAHAIQGLNILLTFVEEAFFDDDDDDAVSSTFDDLMRVQRSLVREMEHYSALNSQPVRKGGV